MPFTGEGSYPDESTVVSHQLVLASLETPRGLTALLKHVLRAFLQHRPENPEMYSYVLLATMLRQRDNGKLDDDALDDAKNGLFPRQQPQRVSLSARKDARPHAPLLLSDQHNMEQANESKKKRTIATGTPASQGIKTRVEKDLQREIDDFVQDFQSSLQMETKPYG